jgi:hypothetical protein
MRQAAARGRAVGPSPGAVDVRGKAGASRAIQAALLVAADRSPTGLAAVIEQGDPGRDLLALFDPPELEMALARGGRGRGFHGRGAGATAAAGSAGGGGFAGVVRGVTGAGGSWRRAGHCWQGRARSGVAGLGDGAAVVRVGVKAVMSATAAAVESQNISMSASRRRASSMLRAIAPPPCGCGPVVWKPASYRHPVTTGPGAAACPGVGGAGLVVVGVTAARLRCWSMIELSPVPSFFGP